MTCFAKIALVTLLMTSALVSADVAWSKSSAEGYSTFVTASFPGCPFVYSASFSLNAFSTKSKFIAVDKSGGDYIFQCSKIDDLYVSFTTSSCDETTVTYQYGNIYDSSNYGGNVPTTFNIDGVNLLESSIEDLEVPVYSGVCIYECTEMCYPEIFEYGTCPETEHPYLSCYTMNCGVEEFIGNAAVSVSWKAPPGTKTPVSTSSSVYTTLSEEYSSMSRSEGSSRYDLPVTITATLNGSDLFLSEPEYVLSELAHTKNRERSKTSNKEKYSQRMALLNN